MPRKKVFGLLWLIATVLIAFFIAGGSSVLIRRTPWSWEQSLSEMIPAPSDCKTSSDTRVALNHLQTRLFPLDESDQKFKIHLHIVKSSEINAFAYLGGEIYINSALLEKARNADEVAGILAHEISHVRNRDVIEGIFGRVLLFAVFGGDQTGTRIATEFMNMKFTSRQEDTADRAAIERLKLAKIDPRPLADFFDRLEKESGSLPALLSDHPASRDRADLVRAAKVDHPTPAVIQVDWRALHKGCSN